MAATTEAKKNGKPKASEMSLRDRIRAAGAVGASGEQFEVEEWGVTVELRSLSVGAKNRLVEMRDGGEAPESDRLDKFVAQVLVQTCYDPETGERVFTNDDADWLIEQPASAVEPLLLAALRQSGLSADEVTEAMEAGKDAS